MIQDIVQSLVQGLVSLTSDSLFPLMFVGLGLTFLLKALVHITLRRQHWFIKEIEKRVIHFLDTKSKDKNFSFFVESKRLLEKTYYESFKVRALMMRRKLDYLVSPIDRLFAVKEGCARLVADTLKETKYLKHNGQIPRFLEISKASNASNPAFSKLFGWIPIGPVNDALNIVPGLFIVGGIFGTFLGIMEALPELSNMDLSDAEGAKLIMDTFLLKISFSLSTSIIGILFSVVLTVYYTILGSEKLYTKSIDTYDRTLTRMWEGSSTNEVPDDINKFDEHADPIEALAHMAVKEELEKGSKKREEGADKDQSAA
jgi:hypothetical protein